jgi:hypothetical protein
MTPSETEYGNREREGDISMTDGPRRTRARAWAAVYLGLFRPDEADGDDGNTESDPNKRDRDREDQCQR